MCDEGCSGNDCDKSRKLTDEFTKFTTSVTEGDNEKETEVFDLIRDIKDPEKDQTLEELNVVSENMITVQKIRCEEYLVKIHFTPTVPHCSLATLIGLCLRVKLSKTLSWKHKLDICLTKGTHATEKEINKQINDKERVAAAMENPNLRKIVEDCLKELEY